MDRDAIKDDIRRLEAEIETAKEVLADIRFQLEDPTELPDSADRANSLRSFEDQEIIVRTLEERRAELLQQLA